jgi:hypothetical protein
MTINDSGESLASNQRKGINIAADLEFSLHSFAIFCEDDMSPFSFKITLLLFVARYIQTGAGGGGGGEGWY